MSRKAEGGKSNGFFSAMRAGLTLPLRVTRATTPPCIMRLWRVMRGAIMPPDISIHVYALMFSSIKGYGKDVWLIGREAATVCQS